MGDMNQLLSDLNMKIEALQATRDQVAAAFGLSGYSPSPVTTFKKRGRPPLMKTPTKGKRTMSPESRARIAEAQKRRWADVAESKATQSAQAVQVGEADPVVEIPAPTKKGGYKPRKPGIIPQTETEG